MNALAVLNAFEQALFAGEDIRPFFHQNAVYEVTGQPPLGGRFVGPQSIHRCFEKRLVGLGPGMQGNDLSRVKFESADGTKAIAQIHEKSWLEAFPQDVLEVKTCSVATLENDKIISLIDYTDSAAYRAFLHRFKDHLPKFMG